MYKDSSIVDGEFPFEEIRQETGNFFDSIDQCLAAGFGLDQIWAVADHEDSMIFGPSGCRVNVLGYVCTQEHHDGSTFFCEEIKR